MDKKLKAKWVKALMSGKYKQGSGRLKRDGKYCCLGVLCEATGFKSTASGFLADDQNKGWAILDQEAQWGLASMNDSGIPFPVIAGFIQENL